MIKVIFCLNNSFYVGAFAILFIVSKDYTIIIINIELIIYVEEKLRTGMDTQMTLLERQKNYY